MWPEVSLREKKKKNFLRFSGEMTLQMNALHLEKLAGFRHLNVHLFHDLFNCQNVWGCFNTKAAISVQQLKLCLPFCFFTFDIEIV